MIESFAFTGCPVKFKDKFYIYPPTVNQFVINTNLNKYYSLLTRTQEDINDQLVNQNVQKFPTPFQELLINCYKNKQYYQLVKSAFLVFIKQQINILFEQKKIIIGNLQEVLKNISSLEQIVFLNQEEYFDFQNLIRQSFGEKIIEKPDPNQDPRVTRIKAKARYRDKIKKKITDKNGINFSTSLISICCMGLGITPLNIGEMSYAAVSAIIQMYQNKQKYETDIKSLMAGADSKKIHPVYWIKNLDD